MKCDELEEIVLEDGIGQMWKCYDAEEVKEAIVELKEKLGEKDEEIYNQKWRGDEWAKFCNQKDKEIESLKASHYAEMVDAGMRERRLRRALFIALAYKAKYKKYWYCELLEQEGSKILSDNKKAKKYNATIKMCQECEVKCRAKAEEYK